jgi:hypothetical protein
VIRDVERLEKTIRLMSGMFNMGAVLAGSDVEANIGLHTRPGIITAY